MAPPRGDQETIKSHALGGGGDALSSGVLGAAPQPLVCLSLFGGFRVTIEGQQPPALATRKHRGLLAYIALNQGRPLSREHLVGLLWGGRAEQQARRSLAQALYDIRRVFADMPDLLIETEAGLVLRTGAIGVDVDRFRTLSREHDVASLTEAANLYTGSVLAGLSVDDEPFLDWLRALREQARDEAIAVHLRLAETLLREGRVTEAVSAARKGLEVDPLNEPLHQALLRGLAACGRKGEAVRHFQQLAARLRSELNIAPSSETSAVLQEIASPRQIAAQVGAAQTVPGRSAGKSEPTIAVFPFVLQGTGPEYAYMASGLADDIAMELGRFHSLAVLARDTVYLIRDDVSGGTEVLAALGATHFVRGTLQVRASLIRISVQLVEVASLRLVWSERYDIGRDEMFPTQDDMVARIVGTLFGKLIDDRTAGARARPTQSLDAYDCVLRGMAIHNAGHTSPVEAREAVAWFDRALQLDPSYARAHAWRACAASRLWPGQPSQAHIDLNMKSISTALSLDPSDSEAHRIKGALHTFQREFAPANYHLEMARSLNPNDAALLIKGGFYKSFLAAREKGLSDVDRAMQRNPLHPNWYWRDKGIVLFARGEPRLALEALQLVQENREVDLVYQAACLAALGEIEEARARVRQLRASDPYLDLARLAQSIPYRCYKEPGDSARLRSCLADAGMT